MTMQNNTPKSKRYLPCLTHKSKHSNGAKDWRIYNKTFKISNSTHPLMARGKMQGSEISAEPSMDRQKNGWTNAKAKAVTYQRHTGRQERPDRSGCSTCRRCTAHTMTSSEHCSWAGSSQVGMAEASTSQPHSSDQGDSGHLAMIYNTTDAEHYCMLSICCRACTVCSRVCTVCC